MSKDYKKDILAILAGGVELSHKTDNTSKRHFGEYLKLNEGVQISMVFSLQLVFIKFALSVKHFFV